MGGLTVVHGWQSGYQHKQIPPVGCHDLIPLLSSSEPQGLECPRPITTCCFLLPFTFTQATPLGHGLLLIPRSIHFLSPCTPFGLHHHHTPLQAFNPLWALRAPSTPRHKGEDFLSGVERLLADKMLPFYRHYFSLSLPLPWFSSCFQDDRTCCIKLSADVFIYICTYVYMYIYKENICSYFYLFTYLFIYL